MAGLRDLRSGWRLGCLVALLALVPTVARPQIVNGSFEDGLNPPTGWVLGPGARVEVLEGDDFGASTIPVPDGSFMVLISTGPGDVPGAPGGDFDGNGTNDFDASTLTTTFTTVAADQELSFAWSFLTDEVGPGGQGQAQYDDLFDVTIDGISALNGSVRKPGGSSPFPDTVAYDGTRYTVSTPGLTDNSDYGTDPGGGRTPFETFAVTIASPGTYTLQFLVADQADSTYDSGLLIDDVSVSPVGDPTIQITDTDEERVENKGGVFVLTPASSGAPSIDAAATHIVFQSNGNLTGTNPNLQPQIWIAERNGVVYDITPITASVDEQFGDPDISSGGGWVVFASTDDLVPAGNADGNAEIFRFARGSGTFAQITSTLGCTNSSPTVNDNGNRIAFLSDCNLGFSASSTEVVLWDGTFRGVDTAGCANQSPRVDRDTVGRHVTFLTACTAGYPGLSNPDGGLEIVQWDTVTDAYLQVTDTPGGFFNDGISASADGRFIAFASDADHEAGENPLSQLVTFRYDRNAASFLQLVDPDPFAFFLGTGLDDSGDLVAVERFDANTGGIDLVLVDAQDPRTQIPVVAGDTFVSNNFPDIGVVSGQPVVAFLSNGGFGGGNPDGNLEVWSSGPAFSPPSTVTYCSTVNQAIPDNNGAGVVDVINVSASGVLADLDVSVVIEHAFVGDIRVDLEHVDTGTRRRLIVRPGRPPGAGCSGNDVDAVLDDEAASDVEDECVTPGPVAIDGTFRPDQNLSNFDGEALAGDWEIRVSDRRNGQNGTFIEWCLIPTTP